MIPTFQRVASAEAITAEEWNRLVSEVERLANIWAVPPLRIVQDVGGPQITLDEELTGGAALTVEDDDGVPSYTDIETIRFDQDDGFTLSNPSAGVVKIDFSGGGGITAEEVDGSPSYASTTTLRFDQTDGFVLSTPAANTARVDIAAATATQAGIVSITTQSFGGTKTFTSGDVIIGALAGSVGTGIVYLGSTNNRWVLIGRTHESDSSQQGVLIFQPVHGDTSFVNMFVVANDISLVSGDQYDLPSWMAFCRGRIASASRFTMRSGGVDYDGVDGSFTDPDGNLITVFGGLIIGITPP